MKSFLLCACFLVFGFVAARAQIPSLIQDSVHVNLVSGWGDTASSDDFWAAYSFENSYADSGNVFFVFTEGKVNGQRIELENWLPGKFTKDSTASALSQMSKTRPFEVVGGDTVSYYREFAWQHPTAIPAQQIDNFYSDDTLEYVIRLRKASNGTELAVLDSLGVLAQNPSGGPVFYGTGPPMAVTEYVIPSTLTVSTDVYISFDVIAKGSGEYYTCRSDQVMGKLSDAVTVPALAEYFSVFNGLAPKRLSQRFEELREQTLQMGLLKMFPNPATSGAVRIVALSPSSSDERKSIMVFSMNGKIVYSYSTGSESDEVEINVKIANQGSYYVVYAIGGEVVSMELLNVVQ